MRLHSPKGSASYKRCPPRLSSGGWGVAGIVIMLVFLVIAYLVIPR